MRPKRQEEQNQKPKGQNSCALWQSLERGQIAACVRPLLTSVLMLFPGAGSLLTHTRPAVAPRAQARSRRTRDETTDKDPMRAARACVILPLNPAKTFSPVPLDELELAAHAAVWLVHEQHRRHHPSAAGGSCDAAAVAGSFFAAAAAAELRLSAKLPRRHRPRSRPEKLGTFQEDCSSSEPSSRL